MCAALVAERAEAPAVAPVRGSEPVVRVEGLNHYYGEGEARNQVLFDNRIEIPAGQLVVMTGPSGAGKTTLLTLIGALRSIHEGRIELLGRDLSRLGPADLVEVRRKFSDQRRTEISGEDIGSVDVGALITEETMVVTISHQGYIKRTAAST